MDQDMVNSFGSSGDILDEEELEKSKIPCTVNIYKDSILPVSYTHLDVYKRQEHAQNRCRCSGSK